MTDTLAIGPAPDRDLARLAADGDAAALGMLFERHRGRLHAHALQLLPYADAQDAVQDTFLIAIRRIGGLRDPEAVVGWLHTILRSVCLSRLRGHRDVLLGPELDDADPVCASETPEQAIESLALGAWVFTAIARLSEPLRVVTMLRHFSGSSSYEEIASICGIPVGTVRSRLSEARRRLGDELLAAASAAHGEAAAHNEAERRRVEDGMAHFLRTGHHDRYLANVADDIEVRWAAGGTTLRGIDLFRHGLEADAADGVSFEPTSIYACPGITILEARFINPAHDPFHCPPLTTQVHVLDEERRVRRMIFHYSRREGLRGEDPAVVEARAAAAAERLAVPGA